MTEQELQAACARVLPAREDALQAAAKRMDELAKPPGSLGVLEKLAVRLSGVTGQVHNTLQKRCVLVFSADNGVVAEGVASGPQSLTTIQSINMLRGLTGVAVLAKEYGSDVWVTDVGIAADVDFPGLRVRKVRSGTGNIAVGPAMMRTEALQTLDAGFQTACEAVNAGYQVLGIGEMGIGNTTTSSAVLCALLGLSGQDTAQVVGRGAGLTEAGYQKKLEVIRRALEVNHPQRDDVLGVLAGVGGLDLAAMTGAFLGAAANRVPVVIDGFISVAAALCAGMLCPAAVDCFFASHLSHERGYRLALDALGLEACLQMDMRLGEGSGCPLMFSVLDGVCAVMNHMATFEEAKIDTDYLKDIHKETSF